MSFPISKKMDPHLILGVFHILLIVPLFLQVGFQKAATPNWVFQILLQLGIFVTGQHAQKAQSRWIAKSSSLWINLIHAAQVGPLLIYLGLSGKKTARPYYEILLMFGFAALGYHLQYLILTAQTQMKPESRLTSGEDFE